jgi:hypothetical protein
VDASSDRTPLRIGALVDGPVVHRWIRELLDAIGRSSRLDLVLVEARKPTRAAARRRRLHTAYERLDRRVLGPRDDALAPADVSDLLASDPGSSAVEHGDVDVILDLRRDGDGNSGHVPTHGFWVVRLGERRRRNGPPYFWEIFDADPLSVALVELLPQGGDQGHVLFRALWATDRLSPHRNRVAACWRVGDAILGRLIGLQEHGQPYLAALPTYHQPASEVRMPFREPTTPEVARHLTSVAAGLVRRKAANLLFEDQWFIVYRQRAGSAPRSGDDSGFKLLRPPRTRFFADPFVIERGGRHYLFFEDYPFETGKGVISCVELGEHAPSAPFVALERPYHLSYPFVFERDGEVYMIPETSENRTIELYRALDFPRHWTRDCVLIDDVVAVDATLLLHDRRYWLFANVIAKGRTTEDELCLFTSASLRGPWDPHPMNPVVSDVRTARPAGRVFERDGHLVRPGQDSSLGYGHAVVLNRIVEMSETVYREVAESRIGRDWLAGNRGTHTYNVDDGYEVLDARRRLHRWARQ